jgi:hypothetical protein
VYSVVKQNNNKQERKKQMSIYKKYKMTAISSKFSEKGGYRAQFVADGYSIDARREILPAAIKETGVQIGEGAAWDLINRFLTMCSNRAATTGETVTVGVLLEPIDLMPNSTSATEAVLQVLNRCNIPVILLDRDYLPSPNRSGYDLIGIDNVQAGYRIARHLIDAGAENIRFLTQPDYASTIRGRIQGFAQAAIDSGMQWSRSNIFEIDPDDTVAFTKIIRSVFTKRKTSKPAGIKRQAFVCRNDALAARLIQVLSSEGLSIPKDAMVAGFDDGKIAQLLNPPLTTISQPVQLLAETAVASLLQRIRTPCLAPRSILLDAPLTIRASTSTR